MSTLPDEFFTVDFDLSVFKGIVDQLNKLSQDGLGNILRGGNVDFVRNTQVYLAAQMQRALKEGGGLAEGQTATIRGQTWRGWALRHVNRPEYGSTAAVGTRYYERKFSRTGSSKASGATWGKWERQSMGMMGVASRPYETVWRMRASGSRYSSSSKLMQDTGRLRSSLILMDTRVNGDNIELRPGAEMPDYFPYQNYLRPLWVIQKDVDYPVIVGYATDSLARVLAPLLGGA